MRGPVQGKRGVAVAARVVLAALIAAGLIALAGCGGGGSTSTATDPGTSPAEPKSGAAGFEVKGADNSIQRAGSEAGAEERAAAAAVLHGYLDARAAGDWARACHYLAPSVTRSLSELAAGGLPCRKALAALSAGLPAKTRAQARIARVGALRSQGRSGFLLFRGAGGIAYFVPMARQGGAWMVAAIAPSPLQ